MSDLATPHRVVARYSRSVGPVLGAFLSGLRRGVILGIRTADGRVAVPPREFDLDTGVPLAELVEVGPGGVVEAWSWVPTPSPGHPLDRPFAWALIRLDGADSALLHVVDAPEPVLRSGLRVRASFRAQRHGSVLDIAAFVPAAEAATPPSPMPESDDPPTVEADFDQTYRYVPGRDLEGFFAGLDAGVFRASRCGDCHGTHVPPASRCPDCGATAVAGTELPDRGTVVAFTVVRHAQEDSPAVPYAVGWILLDGAATPFPHRLGAVDVDDVRIGLRVAARWAASGDAGLGWDRVRCFVPIIEPGADPAPDRRARR
jgi:uncharacterized OB-fold protein